MRPLGPFHLLHQNQYFNGWPALAADQETIVMCFPVEGWSGSAAVTLRQREDQTIDVAVYGPGDPDRATAQALAAISLDEDGSAWPAVGERDPVVADLQQRYDYMRPTMFHSPYEAAAAFIIGHRISIVQTRRIRTALARDLGEHIDVRGELFSAFPMPRALLTLTSYPGLAETKIARLHAVAQAAQDGLLDRPYLRRFDEETALATLQALPGVGPFFAQGILQRGVGSADGFTRDAMTYHAIKRLYALGDAATPSEIHAVTEAWHPFRMWVTVLLHVRIHEMGDMPPRPRRKAAT